MTTIKNLTTALLDKITDCDEVDINILKQFQTRLNEALESRHGFYEQVKRLVPDYKESGCWDAETKTPLITEFQLNREYYSDYGEIEYGGSTHCRFSLKYTYKGVSIEIDYKKSAYNRYAADCKDQEECYSDFHCHFQLPPSHKSRPTRGGGGNATDKATQPVGLPPPGSRAQQGGGGNANNRH